MTFQKTLGQHHIGDRVTVKLAIGNKTYVVKIADNMMEDHLMNTDLINRLDLKDVHAPASKALTNDFKQALKQQIPKEFDPKGTLVGALNGKAMISPMAPGSTIWELFKKSDNDSGKKKLLQYVATEDGAHALGALMTIDLVDGMYDRLFNFNGANYLFDPEMNDLWCIDNAKRPGVGLSSTDDSSWKQWVIGCTHDLDDDTVNTSTDKGKSVPELFHWMIYERKEQLNPGFGPKLNLSAQAKNETAAWIKEAFADTRSALLKLVNDTGLAPEVRDRLRRRLAFLDARNKFTDLLSFGEFQEIPTPTNPWFGMKLVRAAERAILGTPAEQKQGEEWKEEARDKTKTDKQLEDLDAEISDYLQQNPKADDRVLKALFAVRSVRFVRSLKAHTAGLVSLQKLNTGKAWGKLDSAVTNPLQKSAAAWQKELLAAGDQEGAKEVKAATQAFLDQLNG